MIIITPEGKEIRPRRRIDVMKGSKRKKYPLGSKLYQEGHVFYYYKQGKGGS